MFERFALAGVKDVETRDFFVDREEVSVAIETDAAAKPRRIRVSKPLGEAGFALVALPLLTPLHGITPKTK